MKIAHIYKGRKGTFELFLTDGPSVVGAVAMVYATRVEAKAAAKAAGAKPHNY